MIIAKSFRTFPLRSRQHQLLLLNRTAVRPLRRTLTNHCCGLSKGGPSGQKKKKKMSENNRGGWDWEVPRPENPAPTLKLNNSFTRKKEPFVPLNGNTVHWYSCGPTVYDKRRVHYIIVNTL